VDANILIFERIREEQDRGKTPAVASEAGFMNALSAIIDGNVTTVLAGIILYFLGTGPIRGFAVTLIIGVMTSMFAALVIVRLLIQLHVQRNPDQPFRMGRWFADANYRVLAQTKLAFGLSAVLILGGLGWFVKLDPHEKYGIDFLGGATVKVRTESPQRVESMRELVSAIPGDIGESASVSALPGSRVGDDTFTDFRVSFKHQSDSQPADDGEQSFRAEIQRGLASVIQQGPIELAIHPEAEASTIEGRLYLEQEHAAEDVRTCLTGAGMRELRVEAAAQMPNVLEFHGQAAPDASVLDLKTRMRVALEHQQDSAGRAFALAEPIPETSLVGGQAVTDLRDSALKALLLSMFVTVLYIRVRFSEYSYGIAAVVALLHDILLTIGVVALLVSFPFIHVEFDMSLIAVFLTIIGYSINDTIVVFDRIRENRLKSQGSLEEIVNRSINETFSRTVITSTSMATILIVFMFNVGTGNILESFSFVMAFGIFAGTFSSIYIASPIFIWLEKRQLKNRTDDAGPAEALELTGKEELS
ncbi:MAG TPA: protein translocase subunit SecF, partial [Planctomycetota bacterium]|nr:protein translocase subunit SecF [Planctomycetota bacterium]